MYLLHGKMTAQAGKVDELAEILLEASKLVSTAQGCKLYVIGKEQLEAHSVFVTEIWETKDDHDNSLSVPGVRDLISRAMPLLDGQPSKGQELEVLGGAGI